MQRITLFVLFILLVEFSFARTTIQCNNPEYAGKQLDFFQYTDPVTQTPELLFSLRFDKNGKSSTTVEVLTNTYAIADFGIYRGMIFIEPNTSQILNLPPLREKSFADEKNPYFKPLAFWITTADKQQVNNTISQYTRTFNELSDKFFSQLYFRQSKEIFDSVRFLLNEEFASISSPTFQNHAKLTLKLIEVDVFRKKPESYSELFSELRQDYWLHPSFINLFEKTFGGQLSFQAKSLNGNDLMKAVGNKDINYLLDFVAKKYGLNGSITELALLKMLHDGYYSGDFSQKQIEALVGHTKFTQNKNQIIKKAANYSLQKFNHLKVGSNAPIICLNNLDGKKLCSDADKTKFKYLVFADTEMIVCREHLKYLTNIQQRFQKHLEIIIVLRETDKVELTNFMAENKIPGIKLMDENNEFIDKYKIKSFPYCFLLNEKHMVQFTNAKAPLDGFEQQFGPFLQNTLFQRQRNQAR